MKRANNLLTKSLQRLSSGKRIVSPSDDAGGLAVGMKIESSLKRAAASRLNTQNGVSFLQMQDGVLKVTGEILDRMAELKSFSNDVSKSLADRETYNHEFNELQRELHTLKAQKFNGVSLFATSEPDNNPLKINTSDDGLGQKIELSRTGLFENLKSKYGADSVLNTGSHGSYRQLVGEFTRDGGLEDAKPGFTTRNYSKGSMIFKNGPTEAESGYFMALADTLSGIRIEDTGGANSNFIRLADKGGKGFAESFPQAPDYDHTSTKYNSKGERVAYLKGDVVKVQAHYASPGSHIFLKAQTDVPRGIDLESLFASGSVSDNGYFNYVGQDRSNGATVGDKPLTEFLRTNKDLPSPDAYDPTSATKVNRLVSLMVSNVANGYNPDYVLVGTSSIYAPASDWGVKLWDSNATFQEGEVVLDNTDPTNPSIFQFNSLIKGNYASGSYAQGTYVHNGTSWFEASTGNASSTDIPRDASVSIQSSQAYQVGEAVLTTTASNGVDTIQVATDIMKGRFNSENQYSAGDVVFDASDWVSLGNTHHGDWNGSSLTMKSGETIYDGTQIYQNTTNAAISLTAGDVLSGKVGLTANGTSIAIAAAGSVTNGNNVVTTDVIADANQSALAPANKYFKVNVWQKADPSDDQDVQISRTNEFTNLNNKSLWTKTHYSHLDGKTINTSYTRGDNIYYQGKNYVYTSDLNSDHALYQSPEDGYTEFSELLRLKAITEVPMYIDTLGGGGSTNLPSDIYFRRNQDLQFVDRLPGSGEVRSTNMARRTDAPLPPGDEIFNSPDDAFYGGLQAGNDGIYGTMDDYYSSTADIALAQASPHLDADADNNKDLLDISNNLEDFSVADFVDYIQTLANVRAVNGGTMSRLNYAERILEENEINLGAASSRIMDTDMATESARMARQNVLMQAAASMVSQANAMNNVVLSLLQ
jgi:flagellin-like hook-associated protein FlgL